MKLLARKLLRLLIAKHPGEWADLKEGLRRFSDG